MKFHVDEISSFRLYKSGPLVNLWAMLWIYARHFVWLIDFIEEIKEIRLIKKSQPLEDENNLNGGERTALYKQLTNKCLEFLEILDMPISKIQCKTILSHLDSLSPMSGTELQRKFDELANRIKDELISMEFYYVPTNCVDFYKENQFSEAMINRFGDSIYDMEEAGKCFALGRHTACAAHLMRVIESGLKELKSSLGIQKHTPTWDAIIKALRDYEEPLNPKTHKAEKVKLQEIIARVYPIKDAWRNPTQHIERRYSEEEAREVFDASKNFMKILCEYLDTYY